MTTSHSTRLAALRAGGIRSPHVGECTRVLDMNEQCDCGRVSAAGES
ncbi:MAG: hypothetical protein U1F41_10085 [Burkholderiales bacterium]